MQGNPSELFGSTASGPSEDAMNRLIILPLTFAVVAIGTPVQAQSKYDVCAAYARDAMMAFYSSSAVPVPRAARMWNAPP